jgi:hypothetical protein
MLQLHLDLLVIQIWQAVVAEQVVLVLGTHPILVVM